MDMDIQYASYPILGDLTTSSNNSISSQNEYIDAVCCASTSSNLLVERFNYRFGIPSSSSLRIVNDRIPCGHYSNYYSLQE